MRKGQSALEDYLLALLQGLKSINAYSNVAYIRTYSKERPFLRVGRNSYLQGFLIGISRVFALWIPGLILLNLWIDVPHFLHPVDRILPPKVGSLIKIYCVPD